ncbi:MAG: serine/threonine protein kinase [Myxococcota bacterium]|nr:serine/threonine protein kinase [Myxococcota bacterium]
MSEETSPFRKIGRYEILAGLTTGGTSELYLAYTRGPGGFRKYLCLKKLLPDVQRELGFVRMFLDEARITALLAHPGIAQVFDLGEDNSELFLVMEYVSGQDLSKIQHACKKANVPVPLGLACKAIRDACNALHYAHHFTDPSGIPSPVIHRDMSIKNVMVTYDGTVKVIDFGFALARGRLENTHTGTIKGTARFLSPETIQGMKPDARSDLFSTGVVLYELLTGQRAFQGGTSAEIMEAVMQGKLAPPHLINPDVPLSLSEVVMKCVAHDREDRFRNGASMARAIELAMGSTLWDEAQTGAYMQELFKEKLHQSRAQFEPRQKHREGSSG